MGLVRARAQGELARDADRPMTLAMAARGLAPSEEVGEHAVRRLATLRAKLATSGVMRDSEITMTGALADAVESRVLPCA